MLCIANVFIETGSNNKQISLLILEEEVHAKGELGEGTLAWQTCASISFFKTIFFLETKSNSFEI